MIELANYDGKKFVVVQLMNLALLNPKHCDIIVNSSSVFNILTRPFHNYCICCCIHSSILRHFTRVVTRLSSVYLYGTNSCSICCRSEISFDTKQIYITPIHKRCVSILCNTVESSV